MGSPGRRTKFIPESAIRLGLEGDIHMDICGRISRCRLCSVPIQSGERRVVVTNRGKKQMKNGGTAYALNYFYHSKCWIGHFVKYAELPADQFRDGFFWASDDAKVLSTCTVCKIEMDPNTHRNRIRLSHFFWRESVCDACFATGSFIECNNCHIYVHKHNSSPLVESKLSPPTSGLTSGMLICDWCAETDHIDTVKTNKAKARREERQQRKFDAVQKALAEQYAQENRSTGNT